MNPVNAVFLDTEVFDSYNYAYDSPTMQALCKACKDAGINLVIPDPTEKEIRRHIRDRSNGAVDQLRALRTKVPFLVEWKKFPSGELEKYDAWEVCHVGFEQWSQFKNSFDGEVIDYSGLNMSEIMKWYDLKMAPFGKGKKSKEFPDAIAIAILNNYAKINKKFIAVVSRDLDFKKACDRYTSLLYFFSIRSLTESILGSSSSVERFREPIEIDSSSIELAIEDKAETIRISHSNSDLEAELNHVTAARLTDYSIIAIGQHECTIAFEAEIGINIGFDTWGSDWADLYGDIDQDHDCNNTFSGVATVKYSDEFDAIIEVPAVEFDNPEFEIELEPEEYSWK